MGVFQLASQSLMVAITFGLVMRYYCREEGQPRRTSILLLTAAMCSLFVLAMLSVGGACGLDSPSAVLLATAFGTLSLLLSIAQFIPQIWTTWRLKQLGSLSIATMAVQAPGKRMHAIAIHLGSMAFAYTLAMCPGTNISTWISYFVGGMLQGCLLAVCVYHSRYTPPHYSRISGTDEACAEGTASSQYS